MSREVSIRPAAGRDVDRILELLRQVLEIHAALRPDIFVSGTTKYGREELEGMLDDETHPIYVAVDETDRVLGYAFCQLKNQPREEFMVPFRTMYLDDLCVDETCRGLHIGEQLFEYVKARARRLDCYVVTLNVWTGNATAESFYEKMGMTTRSRLMELVL